MNKLLLLILFLSCIVATFGIPLHSKTNTDESTADKIADVQKLVTAMDKVSKELVVYNKIKRADYNPGNDRALSREQNFIDNLVSIIMSFVVGLICAYTPYCNTVLENPTLRQIYINTFAHLDRTDNYISSLPYLLNNFQSGGLYK